MNYQLHLYRNATCIYVCAHFIVYIYSYIRINTYKCTWAYTFPHIQISVRVNIDFCVLREELILKNFGNFVILF